MSPLLITVANQKGGSGKTTLAMLLSEALLRRGYATCVLDADPQASAWKWAHRAAAGASAFPVPVHRLHAQDQDGFLGQVRAQLLELPSRRSVVVLDTPPRLDSAALFWALCASDRLLVPVRPHVAYLDALEEFVALLERVDIHRKSLGARPLVCASVLLSGSGRRRSEALLTQALTRALPWPVLRTALPERAAYADAFNYRTSLAALARTSRARATLEALSKEILR